MKIYLVEGTRYNGGYCERGDANTYTWIVEAHTTAAVARARVLQIKKAIRTWIKLRDNPKLRDGVRAVVLLQELKETYGEPDLDEDNTYNVIQTELKGVRK